MQNVLGDFLKARRGRVRPEDLGLPARGRRRVPGLRRDELAELAGLSEPYLTRLEQGVDRHPSTQVLQALAQALRLDDDETTYLLNLAAPSPGRPETVLDDEVQRLLDSWPDTPAYVRNRRLDVLAANKLAMTLSEMYWPGRNLARDMFLSPQVRQLLPEWEQIAAQTVAALRAEADQQDPRFAALLSELLQQDDFQRLWAHNDVRVPRDETKRFVHPVAGPLELRRQSLRISGAEDQVIIVYQAAPHSPSAAALARLG